MFKKLRLIKETITQLVCYKIFLISKKIETDLSKQQDLDADPRAIQQINFMGDLDRDGNTTMIFIIEEAKETFL